MKILVCVKQVAVMGQSQTAIESKNHTLKREEMQKALNPADGCCFEMALRIKEQYGGSITLVSMGRPETADMLRSLSAVGGDDFFLISDPAFAGADTYATAWTLHRAVIYLGGFDLILCGERTTDGETGQVGPSLAAMLGYRFAGGITGIRIQPQTGESADGSLESLTPLVATVRRSCTLRYPPLMGLRKAAGRQISVLNASLLGGWVEPLTQVIDIKRKEVGKRQVVWYPPDVQGIGELLAESGLGAAWQKDGE